MWINFDMSQSLFFVLKWWQYSALFEIWGLKSRPTDILGSLPLVSVGPQWFLFSSYLKED